MEYPTLPVDDWASYAPQLRDQFADLMYGHVPEPERFMLESSQPLSDALSLRTYAKRDGGKVDVLHAEPVGGARATFVGVNFSGNHTVVDDPRVPEPRGWSYPDGALWPVFRGCHRDRWCVEEIVAGGFGLATFCHSDIVPDHKDLAPPILEKMSGGKPFGAVAAWAWSLLSMAKTFDGPSIFVGHSRMGKAALLAGSLGGDGVGCFQSGSGGAGPSRAKIGETIGQLTTVFPHWFPPVFAGFAGREEELPFDQHGLIALCAPKPVLLLNGDDDEWINQWGQEEMAELARPVYESMGVGDNLQTFRRPGGHSVTPEDWAAVLEFIGPRF